jgi:hypothetical protein
LILDHGQTNALQPITASWHAVLHQQLEPQPSFWMGHAWGDRNNKYKIEGFGKPSIMQGNRQEVFGYELIVLAGHFNGEQTFTCGAGDHVLVYYPNFAFTAPPAVQDAFTAMNVNGRGRYYTGYMGASYIYSKEEYQCFLEVIKIAYTCGRFEHDAYNKNGKCAKYIKSFFFL